MIHLYTDDLTDEQRRKLYAGLVRASKFAEKFAREHTPITEATVKQIHKTIFKDVFPLIAGIYRLGPIQAFEDGHQPPFAEQVPECMRNLVLDIQERSKHVHSAHLVGAVPEKTPELAKKIENVVELAAFAHWRLVWIHPFTDGNGRTARVLSNLILERYGLRPISTTVNPHGKEKYLKALHEANKHNLNPLMNLTAQAEYVEIERHGLPWVI